MLKIIENETEFNTAIKKEKFLIVNFFATWCGPCQMFAPVLTKVAKENDLPILKVDIDRFSNLAADNNIQGVPTTIIFKNGKEVERKTGFLPEPTLLEITKNNNK